MTTRSLPEGHKVDDVRIAELKELLTPETLMNRFPIDEVTKETIYQTRNAIEGYLLS
jgi:phospho-2-dehydro-3-deoxyheptonate aldolase